MLATLSRWRRRVGALLGGFEAGEASRRLRHFQPSRAHLNTLIAAAGADITARARWPEDAHARGDQRFAIATVMSAGSPLARNAPSSITLTLPSGSTLSAST